jgi:hypothetical protein
MGGQKVQSNDQTVTNSIFHSAKISHTHFYVGQLHRCTFTTTLTHRLFWRLVNDKFYKKKIVSLETFYGQNLTSLSNILILLRVILPKTVIRLFKVPLKELRRSK